MPNLRTQAVMIQGQAVALSHDGQACQSAPHTCRTGIIPLVSFSPTAHSSYPVYRLLYAGRGLREFFRRPCSQHMPFIFTEDLIARFIRPVAAGYRKPIDSPPYNHIYRNARLQTVCIRQSSVFYAASALKYAMINLYSPSTPVPV